MTAIEYLRQNELSFSVKSVTEGELDWHVDMLESGVADAMIEFAKMKVKEALEAAVDKVNLVAQHYNPRIDLITTEDCGGDCYWEDRPEDQPIPDLEVTVEKDSILNAYPLDQIK